MNFPIRAWIGDLMQAGSVAAARRQSPSLDIQPPHRPRDAAASARLLHPLVPRKALNAVIGPDFGERALAEALEAERRNRLRGVARQHGAIRRYHERVARPAAHARLGIGGKIIRRDEIDVHDAGEPFARRRDDVGLPVDRGALRHQRIAIGERPAGYYIGDFKRSASSERAV